MAIPVYLQQFKAAGIYRVVFDKSTIAGVDSEILRLVVGYSEKGPFNIPTYITSVSEFKQMYGNISKKLEKRGVFFHRLAIQALAAGPILCLNLKKFNGETVAASTINTDFNPSFETIETVRLNVEDIYDTSRFWELSAEQLNEIHAVDGTVLDQYLNIATTDTVANSATYFIRKASGSKVNTFNITVSDWYSDGLEDMPEYLEMYKNSLISDFFAEVYVFKGKFTSSQVLASSTLTNYFETEVDANGKPVLDENGEVKLKLRKYVTNAFNDAVDTLDALYNDETSGALGHYVGALIPQFKNKLGAYEALNIKFNNDVDIHHLMMSFNTDLLEEDGIASIDLSGRLSVSASESASLSMKTLFDGTAKTTLLGNKNAKVVRDILTFSNNAVTTDDSGNLVPVVPFAIGERKIMGTMYVKDITIPSQGDSGFKLTLQHVGTDDTVDINANSKAELMKIAVKLNAAYVVNSSDAVSTDIKVETDEETVIYRIMESGQGAYYKEDDAFISEGLFNEEGPRKVITSIARVEKTSGFDVNNPIYGDADANMKVSFLSVVDKNISNYGTVANAKESSDSVYGASVTFIPLTDSWQTTTVNGSIAYVSENPWDSSLFSTLQVGDCLLASDGSVDRDGDGESDAEDTFLDNVYVQNMYTDTDEYGNIKRYVIILTGDILTYETDTIGYIVRVEGGLNREIGEMSPVYLSGYTYLNASPNGTGMYAKLQWQEFILSALSEYKGLRIGLLNKSDIDYRYIVDTFETFVENEAKSTLSFLAKEKQSAFAILNFPAVKTFVKCPYTSFTDSKGVFNIQYVVEGFNKKKGASIRFCLPSDADGASFCAFYTPLKFSDGYVDSVVPSAGLVSNLFITKYSSRQPYYIIAGPNYGNISASNLVGPDYNYSQDELQIIEPFGVNCMVYRPSFGTFINANQTAKQTPVSALSKVNVRELVIYLQDEIEKVLQAYQWEFNNARTRSAIKDRADAICARVQANGGIQAYLNVMDESNNTPDIIDNEMAVLSTHIEPGMGCGKMVQELTLYRTGQMASAISD